MTPEFLFFVIAVLIVAFFAVRLLLGNASASGMTPEWRESEDKAFLSTFRRFFSVFGMTVPPVLVLVVIIIFSMIVAVLVMGLIPGWVVPLIAALIFVLACLGVMRDVSQWQARRFEEKLIDAIDVMIAALKVGENSLRAMETTVAASEGTIKSEFQEILNRLDLGLEIDQAVQHMIQVYDSEGVRLFTQSLRAKWEVGGELAEMLISVNRTIRERTKMRLQLGGQLSGIRYAAIFLAVMPCLLYAFFLASQPGWVAIILNHPFGSQIIYIALIAQALGLFWLLRILRSEV